MATRQRRRKKKSSEIYKSNLKKINAGVEGAREIVRDPLIEQQPAEPPPAENAIDSAEANQESSMEQTQLRGSADEFVSQTRDSLFLSLDQPPSIDQIDELSQNNLVQSKESKSSITFARSFDDRINDYMNSIRGFIGDLEPDNQVRQNAQNLLRLAENERLFINEPVAKEIFLKKLEEVHELIGNHTVNRVLTEQTEETLEVAKKNLANEKLQILQKILDYEGSKRGLSKANHLSKKLLQMGFEAIVDTEFNKALDSIRTGHEEYCKLVDEYLTYADDMQYLIKQYELQGNLAKSAEDQIKDVYLSNYINDAIYSVLQPIAQKDAGIQLDNVLSREANDHLQDAFLSRIIQSANMNIDESDPVSTLQLYLTKKHAISNLAEIYAENIKKYASAQDESEKQQCEKIIKEIKSNFVDANKKLFLELVEKQIAEDNEWKLLKQAVINDGQNFTNNQDVLSKFITINFVEDSPVANRWQQVRNEVFTTAAGETTTASNRPSITTATEQVVQAKDNFLYGDNDRFQLLAIISQRDVQESEQYSPEVIWELRAAAARRRLQQNNLHIQMLYREKNLAKQLDKKANDNLLQLESQLNDQYHRLEHIACVSKVFQQQQTALRYINDKISLSQVLYNIATSGSGEYGDLKSDFAKTRITSAMYLQEMSYKRRLAKTGIVYERDAERKSLTAYANSSDAAQKVRKDLNISQMGVAVKEFAKSTRLAVHTQGATHYAQELARQVGRDFQQRTSLLQYIGDVIEGGTEFYSNNSYELTRLYKILVFIHENVEGLTQDGKSLLGIDNSIDAASEIENLIGAFKEKINTELSADNYSVSYHADKNSNANFLGLVHNLEAVANDLVDYRKKSEKYKRVISALKSISNSVLGYIAAGPAGAVAMSGSVTNMFLAEIINYGSMSIFGIDSRDPYAAEKKFTDLSQKLIDDPKTRMVLDLVNGFAPIKIAVDTAIDVQQGKEFSFSTLLKKVPSMVAKSFDSSFRRLYSQVQSLKSISGYNAISFLGRLQEVLRIKQEISSSYDLKLRKHWSEAVSAFAKTFEGVSCAVASAAFIASKAAALGIAIHPAIPAALLGIWFVHSMIHSFIYYEKNYYRKIEFKRRVLMDAPVNNMEKIDATYETDSQEPFRKLLSSSDADTLKEVGPSLPIAQQTMILQGLDNEEQRKEFAATWYQSAFNALQWLKDNKGLDETKKNTIEDSLIKARGEKSYPETMKLLIAELINSRYFATTRMISSDAASTEVSHIKELCKTPEVRQSIDDYLKQIYKGDLEGNEYQERLKILQAATKDLEE